MDENSGTVDICLFLSNVTEATQSDIWATVVSIPDSAMGERGNCDCMLKALYWGQRDSE